MTPSEIQQSLLNQRSQPEQESTPQQKKTKAKAPILTRFIRSTRGDTLFHLFFVALIALECLLFLIFFTFLVQSAFLAINLGVIFATGFTYFILRLHRQAQKPEKILNICHSFEEEFHRHADYDSGSVEYHIALANGYARMAGALHSKEYHYYPLPKILRFLQPKVAKISAWLHWYDVHKMKEALLLRSVNETIKLVKVEPTNLEFHAALANAYVMISGLYHVPDQEDDGLFSLGSEMVKILHAKFTEASEKAIEEFKILNEYSPNDPWVHQQLAYSYHDLKMPQKEITEYENLLSLLPDDDEILYKLGTLYFQEGENAKGLAIYESLMERDPVKAQALVEHYGTPVL